MKVKELIDRLGEFDAEDEVMILDGFNASGHPKEINLGPSARAITGHDTDASADCEGRLAEIIVVLGYGCY